MYGAQKGVREEERQLFDEKIRHFADKMEEYLLKTSCPAGPGKADGTPAVKRAHADYRWAEGAGAAGGLGFAFLSCLPNVELKPGIDIVLDAVGFEEEAKDADIVVTGEGRMDFQTAMGKVPAGVARAAKKHGAKVLAFAGGVTKDAGECNAAGIDAFFPIVRGVTTLEEAMAPENAKENMALSVEQVFRMIQLFDRH